MENPRHTVLRTNLELAEGFLPPDQASSKGVTPRVQGDLEKWVRGQVSATKKELEPE